MKILHVAVQNFAGIPMEFVRMHRRAGDQSLLVTLHRNSLDLPEEVSLDLPLPMGAVAAAWRRFKGRARAAAAPVGRAPEFRPHNALEAIYFRMTDVLARSGVAEAIDEHELDEYETIHYDGGLDFFRDARVAERWKREGKKIVVCYFGSDLRARGIDARLHTLADLRLTVEHDHLGLADGLRFLNYPFDVDAVVPRTAPNAVPRIVHAPSNRNFKGTDLILPVVERLKRSFAFEFDLLERVTHAEVMRRKALADVAIDQIGCRGGTGYGRSSLETLALGVATVTEFEPAHLATIPESPFVQATEATLEDRLAELLRSAELRADFGARGRRWVEAHHSYAAVAAELKRHYREAEI